jgi:hypothetical protein
LIQCNYFSISQLENADPNAEMIVRELEMFSTILKQVASDNYKKLRKSLYMPALVATRYNPLMLDLYERLQQKGKPKKVAKVNLFLIFICH